MGGPEFWDNQERAQKIVAELKGLKGVVDPVEETKQKIEDAALLWEMAEEAGDADSKKEVDQQLDPMAAELDRLEALSLLSGKYDACNAYLTVYAREGGTEAQDWTEMLMRMYLHYCEAQGWKVLEVDKNHGEEAGLKEVTLFVQGPMVFGLLSTERGTHRLARVSPFNAQGKRQTSFAAVEIIPDIEDGGDVVIPDKDLDITPFVRASGPGGQNVNKVATAVRIIHIPTGITVVCSVERKQEQNKKRALAIIQAKIEILEEERRAAELDTARGGKLDMGWGTQIRSYVFYDNRVKDHRTGYEVGNPLRVLDGDIQGFIDAELNRRVKLRSDGEK